MAIKKFSPLLAENPLCGIGEYKDALDLSTGGITRRIKKLVLTGEETWSIDGGKAGVYSATNENLGITALIQQYAYQMSSHFVLANSYNTIFYNTGYFAIQTSRLIISYFAESSVESFKSYLAAQYAAGTPVTVWYVLSTSETETITVPSGLTGTIEGYLTQSGTPTPSEPIYPEANPALTWVPTTYRKYDTKTDVITALPAQIIGDGQPITSCQISGNTVQDGTPTPEDPVDVVGCGVKTGNLVDPTVRITDANITQVGRIESYMDGYYDVGYFPIIQGNTYTIDSYVYACFYTIPTLGSKAYGNMRVVGELGKPSTFTAPITGYCCFRVDSGDSFMANNGAAALPYEPYGYKLPLTVNNTEYQIYLGQVETTRKIGKVIFNGTENWKFSSYPYLEDFITYGSDYLRKKINTCICTHLQTSVNVRSNDPVAVNTCCFNIDTIRCLLYYKDTSTSDLASFKSYLAAQYAAGTPVTIWYVLAEPETGIVNEPLMKIGDYADTVSATNIPTTGTPENFDVGTTLKPSEAQLTYHGWHEHTDTKYTQGE